MTNRLVNKFKRKHDMEQDGIVDISFWEAIMNQAKRKLTKKESFYSRA